MALEPTITLIIDARKSEHWFDVIENFARVICGEVQCQSAVSLGLNCQQIIVIHVSEAAIATATKFFSHTSIHITSATGVLSLLEAVQSDFVGYIPHGATPSVPPPITSKGNFLVPWLPFVALPGETAREIPLDAVAWISSLSIAKLALPQLLEPDHWTVLKIAQVLEAAGISFRWSAARASEIVRANSSRQVSPPLTINSTVLAVVPHYRCEAWLARCLSSLVNQTRPPDGIVVIEDGGTLPVSIVEQFPGVTLLSSPFNVGPYRLIQQVIADTNYDAYLFQDADDWSTSDRLEKLLLAAANTGAELVGTQEIRVFTDKITPVCYPWDVNAALTAKPGHPLLHPSSLVARNLVMRLGGFATGLRFGGDTEFLLRAALAARIVNVPDYCYFRRKRAGSLTTAVDTGLNSPARIELLKTVKSRALSNYAAVAGKEQPCLNPLVTETPIKLNYIIGPKVK